MKTGLGMALALFLCLSSCNNARQSEPQQRHSSDGKLENVAGASQKEGKIFKIEGMETPESFQFDPTTEKYFISNIVGSPTEKDGRGYLTRLDKDGKLDIKEFIIGLNAPKGMTFLDRILYVTDIDRIMGYDPKTGKHLFELDLSTKGAKFLNDIIGENGVLWISDMMADVVYRVTLAQKEVGIFASLKSPNGLAFCGNDILVASWGRGEGIHRLDKEGKTVERIEGEFDSLDGIACDPEGNWYVSNFKEGSIYRIDASRRISKFLEHLVTPADISLTPDGSILLVPSFDGKIGRAHV